ncbi:DUF1800 family protein [Pararhodobacter sp. CCB-MM2]|uniref:DUF1800 domain-containing protein n=1 Tax=Pararhodobacter sp. CCB-MM2 TaxID=1786003 RepID=UPI00083501F3|nr:DUF1800 domain-containing protein [Pararhodobacter sp. CCB-MM2]
MPSEEQLLQAAVAFQRFGLGPKRAGLRAIADDARGALLEELDRPARARIRVRALPSYEEAGAIGTQLFPQQQEVFLAEQTAKLSLQLRTPIGFLERLVMFWSNHFNMSVEKKGQIRAMVGQYERDVIRAGLTGRFSTMLRRTVTHPAMICYLDNADSIGPNSPAGQYWHAGLNENLARELMELHTVGVGGGYTEQDVGNLAKVLSGHSYVRGWEVDNGYEPESKRGQYQFHETWHEPGRHRVLGYRPANNSRQLPRMLDHLATLPQTAQHIAYKLVAHFLTDDPTPELVDPVARAFLDSEGDLKETARALVMLPEAWTLPMAKFRTPQELLIAQARALGQEWLEDDLWRVQEFLKALGHYPWHWWTPDGYPDETDHWLSPNGMRVRADAIQMTTWALMQRQEPGKTPIRLANSVLGPRMSRITRTRIRDTRNELEAFSILFLSPEFQRR